MSLVSVGGNPDGAGVTTIGSTTGGDGRGLDLLDALTLLARDRVLLGEGRLLPLITQQLMQAAPDAEAGRADAARAPAATAATAIGPRK